MKTIDLHQAKANLSTVVEEAILGERYIIVQHGRLAAVLIGFEEWERLSAAPSFGRLLMAAPEAAGHLPDRDEGGLRSGEF